MVAALITPGSDIVIENIMLNPTRTGLIDTLIEMGGDITIENRRLAGGEEVGDLHVKASQLKGITVPAARAPSMIDEYPVLSVAASFAEGTTRMEGLEELRVKESDRLAAVEAGPQGQWRIDSLRPRLAGGRRRHGTGRRQGRHPHGPPHRHVLPRHGARLASETMVDDSRFIATSFPDFTGLMNGMGAKIPP